MSLKIIFMGTPDFSVPSLDILVKNGFNVVAVITTADKYGGRGKKKLLQSPVKTYALKHDIPVLQPTNLKSDAFIEELKSYEADLQIVVAFRMLPVVVWDMPTHGTWNLHGSLLPKYRGAAPINWAIINGDEETGVTSFKLKHQIDTGDTLFQEKIKIGKNTTAGELHDQMMELGAQVILKTVQAIDNEDVELLPQSNEVATHAPKIFKDTCQIDWNQTSQAIHNFIRGLSPYPLAWSTFEDKEIKIIKSKLLDAPFETESMVGTWYIFQKNRVFVGTKDGFIEIMALKPQGRKQMTATDFVNGNKEKLTRIHE